MSLHEIAERLREALKPYEHDREPLVHSRSIKGALERLECEADELKEVALSERPARNIDEALRQLSGWDK